MSKADRTTRYRAEGKDNRGTYFRLTAAGRALVAHGEKPEKVPDKHRVYVVGYRSSDGKQRWQTVGGGITAARRVRDDLRGRKARHERVEPPRKLLFAKAAEVWLADEVGC